MPSNDFIHDTVLKNKTTSYIKIQKVLSSVDLNDAGICLRDGPVANDVGFVNKNPNNGKVWVAYIGQICFDAYGVHPHDKLAKFSIKRNGFCLYSEYKIQGLR